MATKQPQPQPFALPPTHGNVPTYDVGRALTVIAGDTKTGKTTFAASAGDQMLILDFEDSTRFVSGCRSIPVDSLAQLLGILEGLEEGNHDYKLVAVDSVTSLIQLIENETLDGFKKIHDPSRPPLHTLADVDFGAGYARSSNKLHRIISRFHSLQRKGIGALLICHTEMRTTKKRNGQEVTKEVPNLHPKHYQNAVIGKADAVLHLRREVERDDSISHTIYTQADLYTGGIGCRFPGLPATIEPTWSAYAAAVKQATAELQARLKAEAKERAKAEREAKAKAKAKQEAKAKKKAEGECVAKENPGKKWARPMTAEEEKEAEAKQAEANQTSQTQPNKENQ